MHLLRDPEKIAHDGDRAMDYFRADRRVAPAGPPPPLLPEEEGIRHKASGRTTRKYVSLFFLFFFFCSCAILPPIKGLLSDQLIVLCMWDKINARVCTLPKPPNPDHYVITRKGLDPNGLLSQRPKEKGQRAPKRKRLLGIWKRRLIHQDMLKAGKENTCSGCFVRGRTCPECKKK